jgi:tetratricopeptide (TPR) repeat protein
MRRAAQITFALVLLVSALPALCDQASLNLENARKAVVRIQTDGAMGSGFVVRQDGIAVTAWHVLGGSQWARVEFPDGRKANVLGILYANPAKDVAVIRLEGDQFPSLPISDSDKVLSGEQISAIGHPRGGDQRVTSGVILRTRATPGVVKHLQITSPVRPGNSGGPVVNSQGEAVGIVSELVYGPEELYYAIAINEIGGLPAAGAHVQPLEEALKGYAGTAESLYLQGCLLLSGEEGSGPWLSRVDIVRALGCFRQAIEKRKDFFEARLGAGHIYLRLRQTKQAVLQLKEALRICPDDITARHALAALNIMIGSRAAAEDEALALVRLSPEYAPAHCILGVLYAQTDRLPQAETSLKTALRLLPPYAEAHAALGKLYVRQSRAQDAVRSLRKALVVRPAYADARLWLGRAYVLSGRHTDALAEMETAVLLAPTSAEARLSLGLEYLHHKRYSEAQMEYESLRTINMEQAKRLRNHFPSSVRRRLRIV